MRLVPSGPIAAVAIGAAAMANPLAAFVGNARVLVVSASAATDPQLLRQEHDLASFSAEMNDRDLVLIKLVGSTATDTRADKLDAAAVRHGVGLASDRFGVALVGKDGGVKLRRSTPTTVDELFQIIDAMPMCQQEMKTRAGRSEPQPIKTGARVS